MLADAAIEKGRDPSMYLHYFKDSISEMEKERQALTGNPDACIPLQKKGAKKLYVALAGAHTILPVAAIFETVGEDWALSIFEAANYGVFLGDASRAKEIAKRIVDETKERAWKRSSSPSAGMRIMPCAGLPRTGLARNLNSMCAVS
jgi:hypothetical protein